MVGAVFEGVGVSLGSLIGGVLMDKYRGALTFRIFSIGSFVCCILHFIIQYVMEKRSSSKDQGNNITTASKGTNQAEVVEAHNS